MTAPLPPSDERHLGRHHGHEQHVGVERQARHVDDGVGRPLCTSMRGSAIVSAVRLRHAASIMRSVIGVAALPMSIWPQAMS